MLKQTFSPVNLISGQVNSIRSILLVGIVGVTLFSMLILAWRTLQPEPPMSLLGGQQVAQQLLQTIEQDESVLHASAVYVPGTGLVLFTHLDSPHVRTWAARQLQVFAGSLAELPDDETLTWVFESGRDGVQQEVVQAPLNRSADASTYAYFVMPSLNTPVMASADTGQEGMPTAELPTSVEMPVEESQPIVEESVDVVPETAGPLVVEAAGIDTSNFAGNIVTSDFTANFDTGNINTWNPIGGSWSVVDGVLQQETTTDFDLGLIAPFRGSNYTLSARVRYLGGDMGAGFYFNMTNTNSKVGSQMVNFTTQGDALQWGHFDDSGNFAFVDSVSTKNVADGEWHTLSLRVEEDSATFILDSELLVPNMPLQYKEGFVGLLVSQSSVQFDDVRVVVNDSSGLTLGDANSLDVTYSFEDSDLSAWLPFMGKWAWVDGAYEQQQTNAFDRVSALNVQMVGEYQFGSRMRYISGEMGGGLIFNMQQRDSKADAQMVSLTANGTFLQWGYFNSEGVFEYQGGVPVGNMQDGEWHRLEVDVSAESFAIALDAQTVVADVPLTYKSGFVGLFDGQSHVAYDDVRLAGLARSIVVDEERGEATGPEPDFPEPVLVPEEASDNSAAGEATENINPTPSVPDPTSSAEEASATTEEEDAIENIDPTPAAAEPTSEPDETAGPDSNEGPSNVVGGN